MKFMTLAVLCAMFLLPALPFQSPALATESESKLESKPELKPSVDRGAIFEPWSWKDKTNFGNWEFFGGQRFSFTVDKKRNSFYIRNFDLVLLMNKTFSPSEKMKLYFVQNPWRRSHPQAQSSFWFIHGYYEKTNGDTKIFLGKIPVPFNYLNGYPEWHSQVRSITRGWDYGVGMNTTIGPNLDLDLAMVMDGTSTVAEWSEHDKPAFVSRLRFKRAGKFEIGASCLLSTNRNVVNVGEADIKRLGGHISYSIRPWWTLRGEYMDFTSLTQCGPLSKEFANVKGHGHVLESIFQLDGRSQLFVNINKLSRDDSADKDVKTITLGGRYKVSDWFYVIPELWFVKDELPKTHALYDDNRYMITTLFLF